MLKLSVGYQHYGREPFSEIVKRYRESIGEVYFSWIDQPSGRSRLGGYDECDDRELRDELIDELRAIKSQNVKLHLLFNANCYGEDAMSLALEERVLSTIRLLESEGLAPDGVTTTSPAIAYMIKKNYDGIELRASVNMRIMSVEGMAYVSELYDGYCLAKEVNRDIPLLRRLREYATEHGKRITMLANSGCMRNCSGQIFHDNMVAHESEIARQRNIEFLPYTCYRYLREVENHPSVLRNTWIRPEDIPNYEGLCDGIKLATRMHALPGMVIDAYARRKYSGNLLDLFEPGHGPLFAPCVIDNDRFPIGWFEKTAYCDKNCASCGYCDEVWHRVAINSEEH